MGFNFDSFIKKAQSEDEKRKRAIEEDNKKRVEVAVRFINKQISEMQATDDDKDMLANMFGSREYTEVRPTSAYVYFVVLPKEEDKFAKFAIGVSVTSRGVDPRHCTVRVWDGDKRHDISMFGGQNIVETAVRASAQVYANRVQLDERGKLLKKLRLCSDRTGITLSDLRAEVEEIVTELRDKHGVIRDADKIVHEFADRRAREAIISLRTRLSKAMHVHECRAFLQETVYAVSSIFGEECREVFVKFTDDANRIFSKRVGEINDAKRQIDEFSALVRDACELVMKNREIASSYLKSVGRSVDVVDFVMMNGNINTITAESMYVDTSSTGTDVSAGEWQGRRIGIVMSNVDYMERRTLNPLYVTVLSLAMTVPCNTALVDCEFGLEDALEGMDGYSRDACISVKSHADSYRFKRALNMMGDESVVNDVISAVPDEMKDVALDIMKYVGVSTEKER